MKNKILYLLLIIIMVGFTTSCGKKKVEQLDIELEKDKIVTVCTRTDELDGVKIETITTTNYGEDKYAINYKVKAIYTFTDEELYNENVTETEKNAPNYQGITDTAFKYEINNDKKEVITVFAYTQLSFDESIKEQFKVSEIINSSEEAGETCTITGVTREELGI